MTVRARSIKAGLAASTETSDMTAPEASRACPEMVLCAEIEEENHPKNQKPARRKWTVRRGIENPLSPTSSQICAECYTREMPVSNGGGWGTGWTAPVSVRS